MAFRARVNCRSEDYLSGPLSEKRGAGKGGNGLPDVARSKASSRNLRPPRGPPPPPPPPRGLLPPPGAGPKRVIGDHDPQ